MWRIFIKAIEFKQVSVIYPNGKQALHKVSFSIRKGECFALVGESGCGKSTLAKTTLGILPPKTKVQGSITIDDKEIVGTAKKFLRNLRGLKIGFVSQDAFSACNPIATIQDFISEAWQVHGLIPPKNRIVNSLEKLGIENAAIKIKQFPNNWSGGMLQRAGITAAVAHSPALIIADEPTSALDSNLNQSVLDSLKLTNTAILLITHDLRLVEKYADRIAVMKDGQIIETGDSDIVLKNPQHEYTKQLLAVSQTIQIANKVPTDAKTILKTKNLCHSYGISQIVENVDFNIKEGEIIGISGESGCGKSTFLRLLMTIEKPRKGEIILGEKSTQLAKNGFVMPIFQDSLASLDSRWAIWKIITEPLTAKHHKNHYSKLTLRKIASEKLAEVGLSEINLESRPTQLSIGQCQRIAIARALTAHPKIIVADEPTSSLDVLSGEKVMKLFHKTAQKGIAVLIVSHNQELLYRWCHKVFSMENYGLKILQEK